MLWLLRGGWTSLTSYDDLLQHAQSMGRHAPDPALPAGVYNSCLFPLWHSLGGIEILSFLQTTLLN